MDPGGPISELLEKRVGCPYCGELIEILIDPGVPEQNYIEDCQVCCRPITVSATMLPDSRGAMIARVNVFHENE